MIGPLSITWILFFWHGPILMGVSEWNNEADCRKWQQVLEEMGWAAECMDVHDKKRVEAIFTSKEVKNVELEGRP